MSSAKTQISVLFEGATEPTVLRLKPVGMLAAERRWGGNAFQDHPIEGTLLAAWASIGMPGGANGFDAWTATIDELVDDATPAPADDGVAVVPTSATSIEPSPISPPEQE